MTGEEWRPIPGWEGFAEASSHGRIRSLDRENRTPTGGIYVRKGRILTPALSGGGYLGVSLYPGRKTVHVHRAVCEAFHGTPPKDKPAAMHLDGDRMNNYSGNLKWGSYSENESMKIEHGTHANARKTHCANGHEFNEENSRVFEKPTGGFTRVCLVCRRERDRKRQARDRKREFSPEDPRHGTPALADGRFNCKCDPCRILRNQIQRTRRNLKKEGD